MFTINTSLDRLRFHRLRARSRRVLAGVGCFVAVAAASAVLSASAMAATTHCTLVRAEYNNGISATLLGEVCYNGTQAWDPNPDGTTTLSVNLPYQYATDYSVYGRWDYVLNTGSDNQGTEEITGYVSGDDRVSGIYPQYVISLAIECTPSGHLSSQAYLYYI